MKAILEFNLPEDDFYYKIACKSSSMHSALWEFRTWISKELKYGGHSEECIKMLEKVNEEFYKSLLDNFIDFDELG